MKNKKHIFLPLLLIILLILPSCQNRSNNITNPKKEITKETKKNYLNFVVLPDSFNQDVIQSSKVDNNVLYIATTPQEKKGEDGPSATNFFAYDLITKQIKWKRKFLRTEKIFSSEQRITIISNRLYATVLDMEKVTERETENKYVRYLYCFNTENGQQIFKTPINLTTEVYLYQDYLIVGSQVKYENGKTSEFGDTWRYGDFSFNILNQATGDLIFHYQLDSKWSGSPVFYKDYCAIVSDDRSIFFFNLKQQKLIAKYDNKTMDQDPYPSDSSPIIYKNLIFSIKDPRFELVAYDIETGKIVWSKKSYQKENEIFQIFYLQPFIYNNFLICFTNCCQNSLLWINPDTGELQKTSHISYPNYPDLSIGSDEQPKVIGNQLFFIDSYVKFPDLPIVPDQTWEYPKTLFCYNLANLYLQYITEIHPNDYHCLFRAVSNENVIIETGKCLYIIDKNNGRYKDFLFF